MGFLERIVERKRAEVARLKERGVGRGRHGMGDAFSSHPTFLEVLVSEQPPRIIAEVKRASPSKGDLNPALDPVQQAVLYQEGGARAVSILTDEHFQGSLEDLERVAASVDLPLLRKDFVIDAVQLEESRLRGASAVLLIAAILSPEELESLVKESLDLGLEPLVEVHTKEEVGVVLGTPARVVGINSRDLVTFQVDLKVVEELVPLVPKDLVVVAESGISSRADIEKLMAAGVENFLIGEALVRAVNPVAKLRELMGRD